MSNKALSHLSSFQEVADLLGVEESLLRRLFASGIHPQYIWHSHWPEPRFDEQAICDWIKILRDVDLDSLPEKIPPLERPEDAFEHSRRRYRKPSKRDLEIFAQLLHNKVRERLRASGKL
ncbi:MAG: hypothetical protein V1792_07300 [Pseudomonadota bacterium]